MKDKYLVIYKNSVCVIRKITVSEADLASTIEDILDAQGELLTISKCYVSE